jgi:hypothetical protein
MKKVNNANPVRQQAFEAFQRILEKMPGFTGAFGKAEQADSPNCHDVLIQSPSGKKVKLLVMAYSRMPPAVAMVVTITMMAIKKKAIPVIFAPVLSERVLEILTSQGINYYDQDGNCMIRSDRDFFCIHLRGMPHIVRTSPEHEINPFYPRSSRVLRAMLNLPARGWKQRELAEEADVSLGLVAKVKKAMIEESYFMEHDGLLYLRDPAALLEKWTQNFYWPRMPTQLYLRGDAKEIEQSVFKWLLNESQYENIEFALEGLSAAWHLAPEVRNSVVSVYLDVSLATKSCIDELKHELGAKEVESGANLILYKPFDRSVFKYKKELDWPIVVTSPIQTYLDLKKMSGRGEEAATTLYNKTLRQDLEAVANRAKEWHHGN